MENYDIAFEENSQPLFTEDQYDVKQYSKDTELFRNRYNHESQSAQATQVQPQSVANKGIYQVSTKNEHQPSLSNSSNLQKPNNLIKENEHNSKITGNRSQSTSENRCNQECQHCALDNFHDKRNFHFGHLLIHELEFLPPCLRSEAYVNILKYVQMLKQKHNITSND